MEFLVLLLVTITVLFVVSFIQEQMRLRKEEKERLTKRLYQVKG